MAAKENATASKLTVKKEFQLGKFLLSWEMMLIYIFIIINVILMITRTKLYFTEGTIQSMIQSGMDLSPLVLGMIFVLILGDIDVSVAATMVLSGMVTGIMMDHSIPSLICVIAGVAAGALCGVFNGVFVAYFKMPAVIVTISTSMLFRGIVEIILDVNTLKHFPTWYNKLAWDNIGGIIPVSAVVYTFFAIIFGIVLHRSTFGRKLYIVGNNATCANYSGIRVEHVKLAVFIIMGTMAGVASIFFVGRMGGGISSSMGTGYEMDAIAIAVLGGVSTNGGKGKVYGPFIATFIMSFLTYTLGLMNIDANNRKIVTGFILIAAILIPNINEEFWAALKLRFIYGNNRNVEALNIQTAKSVHMLNETIAATQKDTSLSDSEKAANIQKLKASIAKLEADCKTQTAELKAVQKKEIEQMNKKTAALNKK